MKNITKRVIAAALSAATMLSSMAIVPTAGAAEEDNKASAIEIKVGETYNIWDSGTQKHGSGRTVLLVTCGRCIRRPAMARRFGHTVQTIPKLIPAVLASRTRSLVKSQICTFTA